jgi:leucyl aminopeptidase
LLGAGLFSPVAGAKLLEKFAGETAWAHLDIAGVTLACRRTPFCPKGPPATACGCSTSG